MGFAHRAFVAAGVGIAVSAIAGCGSSGGRWLSQSEASTLSGQLNQITQALNQGECDRAQRYLADFQSSLSGFSAVNSTLIANLNQGATTIASLTSSQCAPRTVTTPRTHTRTRTTTTTTTTATQTLPTFTQTTTYPTQTYTYTPPDTTTTSTTGGVGPGGYTTTTTSTTSSTTTPSGGGGLGDTSTAATTSTTSSTSATTSGFGNGGGGF